MGVDKWKDVEGVPVHQLRFIAIMTALNIFLRKLSGDSDTLPQASLLNMPVLEENDSVWTNEEDLKSCFNLFSLPPCWRGFFCFLQTG